MSKFNAFKPFGSVPASKNMAFLECDGKPVNSLSKVPKCSFRCSEPAKIV